MVAVRLWHSLLLACIAASSGEVLDTLGTLGNAKLYLMRHGQSWANVWPHRLENEYFYHSYDVELTHLGKQQAIETSHCLAKNDAPDLVIASCLVRAQETALLAFPNATVHVAPYISERPWEELEENVPTKEDTQRDAVRSELSNDASMRDDFSWVEKSDNWKDWPESCGPPNWNSFLDWLAKVPDVREVIRRHLKNKTEPLIAVVSHGMFLEKMLEEYGGPAKMMATAEVIVATLPLHGFLGGSFGSFSQFGTLTEPGLLCKGNDPKFFAGHPFLWFCLVIVALVFAWKFIYRCFKGNTANGRMQERLLPNLIEE